MTEKKRVVRYKSFTVPYKLMTEQTYFEFSSIVSALPCSWSHVGAYTAFSSVVIDGRQAQPGSLFVAIQGPNHDGHSFVDQAVEQGATGVLVGEGRGLECRERFPQLTIFEVEDTTRALATWAAAHRRSSSLHPQLKVIGVTGSYGKTTTKNMVASILRSYTQDPSTVLATEGNLNNHWGVPLTLLRLHSRHRFAVIEMGMSALGEISHLAHLAKPDLGIITNIGPAHLEQLGSLGTIAQAKQELFQALPNNAWAIYPSEAGILLFPPSPEENSLYRRLRPLSIGKQDDLHQSGVCSIGPVETSLYGTHAALQCAAVSSQPAETIRIYIPFQGAHHVHNAALASAVARVLEIPTTAIVNGLAQTTIDKHRGQLQQVEERIIIDDCYNANPISMRAAIQTLASLRPHPFSRIWVLLGDMLELGPEENKFHQELGEWIGNLPDEQRPTGVFTLGERALHIANALREKNNISVIASFPGNSLGELVQRLWPHTSKGDVVLVKGSRGMQLERIFGYLQVHTQN